MQAPTSSLLQLYRTQWALLIALAVGPTMVACGAQPTPPTGCTAGIQIQCPCPGGAKGVQVCLPEGGFGPCTECSAADAAPTDSVGAQDTDAAGNSLDQIDGAGDLDAALGDTAPVVDASAATPTCSDLVANGLETDIDCGGPSCGSCPTGSACGIGSDCKSAICVNQKCQAPDNCKNKKKDDLETDVDCGGAACPSCGLGMNCLVAQDCGDGACVNGSCGPGASCNDGKTNGQETATDCGGPVCAKCAVGSKCAGPTDCLSNQCLAAICSDQQGCANGVKGGKETDVDCGGDCGPCEAGKSCVAAVDCTSKLCINSSCTAPSCSDQVKNGQEADVDCGGGADCVPCANGQTCQIAADCLSQLCFNGACKAQPTCSDGVKNGTETFKDCGGSKCSPCEAGQTCLAEGDCASKICKNSVCQPATCSDGVKNGKETAIDCGGGEPCAPCALGLACKVTADCATAVSPCSVVGCSADKCAVGGQKACDDAIACTADKCDPSTGQCVYTADAAKWCNDGNICTDDSCSVKAGCVNVQNSAQCSDGNACTTGDTCTQGQCAGTAVSPETMCDDQNPCTDEGCDPKAGCGYSTNSAPCNADGDACTINDICVAKKCTPGPKKMCDDQQACTLDSCDKVTATCSYAKDSLNGKTCDDESLCTSGDLCSAGKCVGKELKNCSDANPCTTDSCSPSLGCVNTPQPGVCSDGNACTLNDICVAGLCTGSQKSCDDGNKCTVDACASQSGACSHPDALPGAGCESDGNLCTTEACAGSACKLVAAKNCDDSNECTVDTCDSAAGVCKYTNKSMPCAGGTGYCSNGKCNCGSAVLCGGVCIDTTKNTANCGACGKLCEAGSACNKSVCTEPIIFSISQTLPAAQSNVGKLATADLNGDGSKDILSTNGSDLSILLGNSQGQFVAGPTYAKGLGPHSVCAGDFNGDAKIDVVVGPIGYGLSSIHLFLNTGDGLLGQPVSLAVGTSNGKQVNAGDVSGDGVLDIVVSNDSNNSLAVLIGLGSGNFAKPVLIGGFQYPHRVAIGDIDGNGSLDIAVPNRNAKLVSVLLNKGDGTFNSPVHFPISGLCSDVAIGDVNLDGISDLAVASLNSPAAGELGVLKGTGKNGIFSYPVGYAVAGQPSQLVVKDLGKDGLPDVLVCGTAKNQYVFVNSVDGTLSLAPAFEQLGSTIDCLAEDLNGDGLTDVVLKTYTDVAVYLNKTKK